MRKQLNQQDRIAVYNKCNGHCAYCGCELEFKDMQVDHVIALSYHNGADELFNMLPACRSCNHRKGRSSLESFREQIELAPTVLMRDSVTYKNAVRFGLVKPTPHKIVFYFEKIQDNKKEI